MGDFREEGYEDVFEQELSYGIWLREYPLPMVYEEKRNKELSFGTCSKSLFSLSSSQSICGTKEREEKGETKVMRDREVKRKLGVTQKVGNGKSASNELKIEIVAGSLGDITINNNPLLDKAPEIHGKNKGKKWSREKSSKRVSNNNLKNIEFENDKRNLVDVMVIDMMVMDGPLGDLGSYGKKRKQGIENKEVSYQNVEAVLEGQHRLIQQKISIGTTKVWGTPVEFKPR